MELEIEDEYVFWKGYISTQSNPMIKLRIVTDNSQNLYLDNIYMDKVINNTDNSNGNFTVDFYLNTP